MATDIQHIRIAAMNLLAMREHSEVELRGKLLRKFDNTELINMAIGQLTNQQLISDKRFAEAFINMRFRQLKGPLLIALELKSKGVESALISSCFEQLNPDWEAAAEKARIKKFGPAQPDDPKDKAKQARYLHSRGYSGTHIKAAFEK